MESGSASLDAVEDLFPRRVVIPAELLDGEKSQ
jgi:hypothetical protein